MARIDFHQAESGLSARQFCRDNDVYPKYFSIRKKQLGLRSSAFVPVLPSKRNVLESPVAILKSTAVIMRHGKCCLHFEVIPDSTWLPYTMRVTRNSTSLSMSAFGVRRDKAALSPWVKIPLGYSSSRKQPEQLWRQRNGWSLRWPASLQHG